VRVSCLFNLLLFKYTGEKDINQCNFFFCFVKVLGSVKVQGKLLPLSYWDVRLKHPQFSLVEERG